jgi:hypothetical protein
MLSGRAVVAVGAVVLATGGAVLAQADDKRAQSAQNEGGLAISPALVEHPAAPGSADAVTIYNRSSEALDIDVTARPWTQSASGEVSPNRRSTLRGVSVSEDKFTLAPGQTRVLTVTRPASASALYGALEVVGLPRDIKRQKGIALGYRLITPLRYVAAVPSYALSAGAAKVVGKGSKRMVTLTLRSTGNTVAPVTGTVRVRGPLGTRQGSIKATRILPGKRLRLPLVSARGLEPGRYTATVTLRQGDKRFELTKRLRVRR